MQIHCLPLDVPHTPALSHEPLPDARAGFEPTGWAVAELSTAAFLWPCRGSG